jgi:hypothetical protein
MSFAPVAVGVPHRFVGDGWDPAPLILTIGLVVLIRLAGLPLRLPSLVGALVGGLLIDLVTDVYHVSPVTAIAVLALPAAIVALARIPAH